MPVGAACVPTIEPAHTCIHSVSPHTVTLKGTAGLKVTVKWTYASQTGDGLSFTFTPDLKNKPTVITAEVTAEDGKGCTATATVFYCSRIIPPPEGGHGDDDDHECEHCRHWCETCEVEYPCWHGHDGHGCDPSAGGTNAPPVNGTNAFYRGIAPKGPPLIDARTPEDYVTFYPSGRYPGGGGGGGVGGGGGCCPCPEHNGPPSGGGGGGGPAGDLRMTAISGLAAYTGEFDNLVPLATGTVIPPGTAVHVTGIDPSYAPGDRTATFKPDNGDPVINTFTVRSAYITAAYKGYGSITADDVRSSLDPPKWGLLLPPSARRIDLHDFVSLPGDKTLSFEGTDGPYGIWDMDAPYSGMWVLFPGETLTNNLPENMYIEFFGAVTPVTATLTYTFKGTGIASNYNCSVTLKITTATLRLEMPPSPNANAVDTPFHAYRQGHHAVTNNMMTFDGSAFVPHQLWVVANVWEGIESVRHRLLDVTRHNGFCENAATETTGTGYDDVSFLPAFNSTNATAYIEGSSARQTLYCRDYGGYCSVVTDFIGTNNTVIIAFTNQMPNVTPQALANGDHISDYWRTVMNQQWAAYGLGTSSSALGKGQDAQPAKLGNARTDDKNLSHGAAGDGLTVWQEYRGFVVGGSKDRIGTHHTTLSPYRKSLLVQVMAEDDYSAGIGTGAAVNPNVNWGAFNVNAIMQDVAKFYSNPTNGLGIDLYWTVTKFTMPTESHTYTNGEFVVSLYKHTGTNYLYYNMSGGQAITNGTAWIYRDDRLKREDRLKHNEVFGEVYVDWGLFVQHNRNDTELKDFVKLILPSRVGMREEDGTYTMEPETHALNKCTGPILESRGARVDIVNISEEQYLKTQTHISATNFVDLIKYCIGHELFHLIGGTDRKNNPGYISGPPSPFGGLKAYQEELLEVNLPARFSILP